MQCLGSSNRCEHATTSGTSVSSDPQLSPYPANAGLIASNMALSDVRESIEVGMYVAIISKQRRRS